MKRAVLHICGAAFHQTVSVDVLTCGPKRARVRLRATAKIPPSPGRWVPKGSTVYVPANCLRETGG